MIETNKYQAWGCDPEPDWMDAVRKREAVARETSAIQAAVDAATDDWALAVKGPDAERAEHDERCERVQRRRREIIAALDAEGPVPITVTAYVWRATRVARPAKTMMVDRNREERERWTEWARRRHPEWGKDPKTPRRLAPAWERRTVAQAQEAATAVFLTFTPERPTGCPHCVEDGLLSESSLDRWDELALQGTEEYRLTVPEPWERRYWGNADCTDIVNCAFAQARLFVLQKKGGDRYHGYKSRACMAN